MKVRCIDNKGAEGLLTYGATYEVVDPELGKGYRLRGLVLRCMPSRFEVIDEHAAQPEPAKVDPYEQHRLREADLATMLNQRHDDSWPNVDTGLSATALLHRNLAAEKPRERQVAFPREGRSSRVYRRNG